MFITHGTSLVAIASLIRSALQGKSVEQTAKLVQDRIAQIQSTGNVQGTITVDLYGDNERAAVWSGTVHHSEEKSLKAWLRSNGFPNANTSVVRDYAKMHQYFTLTGECLAEWRKEQATIAVQVKASGGKKQTPAKPIKP